VLVTAGCSFDASGVDTEVASVGASTGSSSTTTASGSSTGAATTATDDGSVESSGSATTTTATTLDTSSDDGGGSSSSSTGFELPACPDLLWIAGDLDPSQTTDGPYHAALVERGYAIEMMLDVEAVPNDANGKCAVLFSAVGSADAVDLDFREVDVPIITWEPNLFDGLGYTGNDNVGTYYGNEIEILEADHPLAAGLVGTVQIHEGVGEIAWGLAPGETIIASVPGVPSQATIIAFDTGDPMPGLESAPARRVGLPFHNAEGATPTKAALELLAVAVAWATES
jgi:hypothetical protein